MKAIRHWWIFTPAILFYFMVLKYALNLPNMDDYEVVLQTVLDIKHGDFWGTILRQHNEHRPALSRLLYWFYYCITGGINFKVLTLIGDSLLLIPAIIGVYFIKKTGIRYWQWGSFVWCLLLFDLNTFEANDWTMCACSSYGTIALFFLSIYFCGNPYLWKYVAILCQFLMIYSNGNGMVGAVVVFLFVGANRNLLMTTVSATVTAVGVALYFTGYAPTGTTLDFVKAMPYFIQMTGAPINFDWSFLFGLIILSALVFLWPKISGKKWWPVLAVLYFTFLTMGVAAVFRSGMPGAQFQTSRYLIYPEMLLAIVFIMGLNYWKDGNQIRPVIVTMVLLICYYFNFQLGVMGYERYQYREANMKFYHPDWSKCQQITEDACNEGVYCIEDNR